MTKATQNGAADSSPWTAGALTLTRSITVPVGANYEQFLVGAYDGAARTVATMTCGGIPCNFVTRRSQTTGATPVVVEGWELTTSNGLVPGTQNVVVTFSGNALARLISQAWNDVDQASPTFGAVGNGAAVFTAAPSVAAMSPGADDVAVGVVMTTSDSANTLAAVPVAIGTAVRETGYADGISLGCVNTATGTISWTEGNNDGFAAVGYCIKGASAAPAVQPVVTFLG